MIKGSAQVIFLIVVGAVLAITAIVLSTSNNLFQEKNEQQETREIEETIQNLEPPQASSLKSQQIKVTVENDEDDVDDLEGVSIE